jgi:hypothetical protein
MACHGWEASDLSAGGFPGSVSLGSSYWQDALFRWSKNHEKDLKHSAEFAQKALTLDDSNSSALDLIARLIGCRGGLAALLRKASGR